MSGRTTTFLREEPHHGDEGVRFYFHDGRISTTVVISVCDPDVIDAMHAALIAQEAQFALSVAYRYNAGLQPDAKP